MLSRTNGRPASLPFFLSLTRHRDSGFSTKFSTADMNTQVEQLIFPRAFNAQLTSNNSGVVVGSAGTFGRSESLSNSSRLYIITGWLLPLSLTLITVYEDGGPTRWSKATTSPVLPPCQPQRILTVAPNKLSIAIVTLSPFRALSLMGLRRGLKAGRNSKPPSSCPAPH
jgi:hypothetical protein